ncbi:hypothetical protein T03_1976 [Trichinella britovi]|uniref:Uncharacterized protein n=1 Tax=Trichinella britovi TaxID=45882 RepID=A0A0V1CDQ3_TRIBR|nr:hypothetical protein T03_1976 [Trichinella britovi]
MAAIPDRRFRQPGSARRCGQSEVETGTKGGIRGSCLDEYQWSGIEFLFIEQRLLEELQQRLLDRANEAFPKASHLRYSGLPAHGGLGPHPLVARVESNLTRGLESGSYPTRINIHVWRGPAMPATFLMNLR